MDGGPGGWPSQQGALFLGELRNPQKLALMGHNGARYDSEACLSITTIASFLSQLKNLDLSQLAGSGTYLRFLIELVQLATSDSAVGRSAVSAASGPLFPFLERLFPCVELVAATIRPSISTVSS
jgi:hypothetical protein